HPRRYFSSKAMESLITSVRQHGILQPMLVRPMASDTYELVAGERRYRAAQAVGLTEVPVVIRDLTSQEVIQVALLENLQREDLNPVEETEAILQLLCINLKCSCEEVISLLNQVAHIKKQGGELTNNVIREQWEIVERLFNVVGRLTPDSFRSNRLPLLNLPDNILESLRQGKVEYTKARAIAQLKDENERHKLLEKVVEEELSVREIRDYINTNKPSQHQDELLNRVNLAYKKMKQVKVWEDSQKRKLLEKLVLQLEKLIE
ncbi:MAG: chromosome partitioning protein ParB, partial [Leptolyngbya sp.]